MDELTELMKNLEVLPIEETFTESDEDQLVVMEEPVAVEPASPPTVELPILKYRAQILRSIEEQLVVVIQGDTGCGKSTQVPQFILQSVDRPRVFVTQPRRIAAITLAERVSKELGCTVGGRVGFRVGQDGVTSSETELFYVTTGWLLQMLLFNQDAFYDASHIVLDEVHERSIDSDLLCYLLKEFLKLGLAAGRPIPKLVVMSATLDSKIFCEYFHIDTALPAPEIMHVGVKKFTVDIHFLDDMLRQPCLKGADFSPRAASALCAAYDGGRPPSLQGGREGEQLLQLAAEICNALATSPVQEVFDGNFY
jgi:HrpA-like RNA helicase